MQKKKTCKQCGKQFEPYTSLQPTCSPKCLTKYSEAKLKEKKKKAKEKRAVSVSVLKAKLWTLFSRYVRMRDADEYGMSECVTCGVRKHWKEMQAGHFVPAGSSNYLRFVEQNVHTQDAGCNIYKHSNPIEYRIFMENKYGKDYVEKLISLRNEEKRFTAEELMMKIEEYQEKVDLLERRIKG